MSNKDSINWAIGGAREAGEGVHISTDEGVVLSIDWDAPLPISIKCTDTDSEVILTRGDAETLALFLANFLEQTREDNEP